MEKHNKVVYAISAIIVFLILLLVLQSGPLVSTPGSFANKLLKNPGFSIVGTNLVIVVWAFLDYLRRKKKNDKNL